MAIATYEGNEPYIFFSYAHKDSDVVLPIIEALANNGFRVWYDAGVNAGDCYVDELAERISHSAVVVVFLSKAYLQSKLCYNEIRFALTKEKQVISVYIEDVALTPGMKMQLSTTHALFGNRKPYKEFLQELIEACSRALNRP